MPRPALRLLALFLVCLFPPPVAQSAQLAPSPDPAIKVAPGFELTRVYTVPRESAGSWVSLAADNRGRLYASDQYGPVYRIELPREANGTLNVRKLPVSIGGAHGLS